MAEQRYARLLASSFLSLVALGMILALTAAPQAGCADPASGGTTTTTTTTSGTGTGTGTGTAAIGTGTGDVCDPMCLEDALATGCTAERSACLGDTSCAAMLNCIETCGQDDVCQADCVVDGTPTTQFDGLQACACDTQCPLCVGLAFCN